MPFSEGGNGQFFPQRDAWAKNILDYISNEKAECPVIDATMEKTTSPPSGSFVKPSLQTMRGEDEANEPHTAINAGIAEDVLPEEMMSAAYHLPARNQRSSSYAQAGDRYRHHATRTTESPNDLYRYRSIDFPNVKSGRQIMEFLLQPPVEVYVGSQEIYRLRLAQRLERQAARKRHRLLILSQRQQSPDSEEEEEEGDSGESETDEDLDEASLVARIASEPFPPTLQASAVAPPPTRCYALWRGIRNLGNTCYLNSVLQMLSSIAPIRRAILSVCSEGTWREGKEASSCGGGGLEKAMLNETGEEIVVSALFKSGIKEALAQMAFSRDPDGIDIRSLTKSLGLNTQLQQDAAECFTLLLDWLEHSGGPQMKTIIEQTLQGSLLYDRRCKVCNRSMMRAETFLYLSTPTCRTLLEGIEKALLPEEVEGYACEGCGKNVGVTSYTYLRHIPSTFCVHLNRFEFDMQMMERRKVTNAVALPLSLNLSNFVNAWAMGRNGTSENTTTPCKRGPFSLPSEEEEEEDENHTAASLPPTKVPSQRVPSVDDRAPAMQENVVYELCSILHHHGNSAYSGHYTFSLKVDPEEEPELYAIHGIPLPCSTESSLSSKCEPPVFLWRHFNDAYVTVSTEISDRPTNTGAKHVTALPLQAGDDASLSERLIGKVVYDNLEPPPATPSPNDGALEGAGSGGAAPPSDEKKDSRPDKDAVVHSASAYMLVYRRREVKPRGEPPLSSKEGQAPQSSASALHNAGQQEVEEVRPSSRALSSVEKNKRKPLLASPCGHSPHPSELPPYLMSYLRRLNADHQQASARAHQRFAVSLDFFLRWKKAADVLFGSSMPLPQLQVPPSTYCYSTAAGAVSGTRGQASTRHVDPMQNTTAPDASQEQVHSGDVEQDEENIFYAIPQEWLASFGRCFIPLEEAERLQVCLRQVALTFRSGFGSTTSDMGYASGSNAVMPFCTADHSHEPNNIWDRPLPDALRNIIGTRTHQKEGNDAMAEAPIHHTDEDHANRHGSLYEDLLWMENRKGKHSEKVPDHLPSRPSPSTEGDTNAFHDYPEGSKQPNSRTESETDDDADYDSAYFTPDQCCISVRMVLNLQCPHGKVAPWGQYKVLSQRQLREMFSAFEARPLPDEASVERFSDDVSWYAKPFSDIIRELRLRGLCISDSSSQCPTCARTFAKAVHDRIQRTFWDAVALQWCRGKYCKSEEFLSHLKHLEQRAMIAGQEAVKEVEEHKSAISNAFDSLEEATKKVYVSRKTFLIWKTIVEQWAMLLRDQKEHEQRVNCLNHLYGSAKRGMRASCGNADGDEDESSDSGGSESSSSTSDCTDFDSIFNWEGDDNEMEDVELTKDEARMVDALSRSFYPQHFTDHLASELRTVSLPLTTYSQQRKACMQLALSQGCSTTSSGETTSNEEDAQGTGDLVWRKLRHTVSQRLAKMDPSMWVASSDLMLALVKHELEGFPAAPNFVGGSNPFSRGSRKAGPASILQNGSLGWNRRGALKARHSGGAHPHPGSRRGNGLHSGSQLTRGGRGRGSGSRALPTTASWSSFNPKSAVRALEDSVSGRYRRRWCVHARWREGTPVIAVPAAVAAYIRASVSAAWVAVAAWFVAVNCEHRGDKYVVRESENACHGYRGGFGNIRLVRELEPPSTSGPLGSGALRGRRRQYGGGGRRTGGGASPSPSPLSSANTAELSGLTENPKEQDVMSSVPSLALMNPSELARYMVCLLQSGFFASTDGGDLQHNADSPPSCRGTSVVEGESEWAVLFTRMVSDWSHLVRILFQSIPVSSQTIYITTIERPHASVADSYRLRGDKNIINHRAEGYSTADSYNQDSKDNIYNILPGSDIEQGGCDTTRTGGASSSFLLPSEESAGDETTKEKSRGEVVLYRTRRCQACEQEDIRCAVERERRRVERAWLVLVLHTLDKAGCLTSPQYEKLWRDQAATTGGGVDTLPQPHAVTRDMHPNIDLLSCSTAVRKALEAEQHQLDAKREAIRAEAEAVVQRLEEKMNQNKSTQGRSSGGNQRKDANAMENLNAITIRYAKRGKKGGRRGGGGGGDASPASPNSPTAALDASLSTTSPSPISGSPASSPAPESADIEQELESARVRLKRIEAQVKAEVEGISSFQPASKEKTEVDDTTAVALPPAQAVHRVGCVPTWWVAEWYEIHHRGDGEKTRHLSAMTSTHRYQSIETSKDADGYGSRVDHNDDESADEADHREEYDDNHNGAQEELEDFLEAEMEEDADGSVSAPERRSARIASAQDRLLPPPSLQGVPLRKPALSYEPFICAHGGTMLDPTWLDPQSNFWLEHGPRRAHLLFSSVILSCSAANESLAMRMLGQRQPPSGALQMKRTVHFSDAEKTILPRESGECSEPSDEDARVMGDEEEELLTAAGENQPPPQKNRMAASAFKESGGVPKNKKTLNGRDTAEDPKANADQNKTMPKKKAGEHSGDSFSSLDVEDVGSEVPDTSDRSSTLPSDADDEKDSPLQQPQSQQQRTASRGQKLDNGQSLQADAAAYWDGLTMNVWEPYLHFYPPLTLIPENELLVLLQHYAPQYLEENTPNMEEEPNATEDREQKKSIQTSQSPDTAVRSTQGKDDTKKVSYAIRWDKIPHVQHTLENKAKGTGSSPTNAGSNSSQNNSSTRTSFSIPICPTCRDEVLQRFLHRITYFSGQSSMLRIQLQLRTVKQRSLCSAITELRGNSLYYDDCNKPFLTPLDFRSTLGSLRRLLRAHVLHSFKIKCPLEAMEIYRGTKKKPLKVRLPRCPDDEIPSASSPAFAALLQLAAAPAPPSTGLMPLTDFTSLFELGIRDGDLLTLVCNSAVSQFTTRYQSWDSNAVGGGRVPRGPSSVRFGTVIDQDAFQSTNLSSAGRSSAAATTSTASTLTGIIHSSEKPPVTTGGAVGATKKFVFPDLNDLDPEQMPEHNRLSEATEAYNNHNKPKIQEVVPDASEEEGVSCPVCTFLNASGMRYCEICESPLG